MQYFKNIICFVINFMNQGLKLAYNLSFKKVNDFFKCPIFYGPAGTLRNVH